jgi:Ca2+-binding EF-hand superfamily protein
MIASLDALGEEPRNQMLYVMLKQKAASKVTHLDFYEFLEMITNRPSTKYTRQDMKKIFFLLDEDKSGVISL